MSITRLQVVHLKANEEPSVIEIDNTLEVMQALVGGYIQVVPLKIGQYRYVKMMDEEGKLKGKRPNLILAGDCIVGDVVFTKFKQSQGEFVSLGSNDIKRIKHWISWNTWDL